MGKKNLKATEAARKSGLYTPKPKQQRVIERHLEGQSARAIANAVGIDRDTVSRILSQSEVTQLVAKSQSRLMGLIHKAECVFERTLDSSNENLSFKACMNLFEGVGVLPNGGLEISRPEEDQSQRRIMALGQLTDMVLNKARRYGISLPPGYEGMEKEALKMLDEPSPARPPQCPNEEESASQTHSHEPLISPDENEHEKSHNVTVTAAESVNIRKRRRPAK